VRPYYASGLNRVLLRRSVSLEKIDCCVWYSESATAYLICRTRLLVIGRGSAPGSSMH